MNPKKINWDKCYESIKEVKPKVQTSLTSRVNSEIQTAKQLKLDIELNAYPPHLRVTPWWEEKKNHYTAFREKGKDVNEDKIRKIISEVAKEYNLNIESGHYQNAETAYHVGERRFIYDHSHSEYTMTPDFKKYKNKKK